MLMVSNMGISNGHLPATYTGTDITHAVIITDRSMLIVRISIPSLGRIPHNGILILCIPAD